MLLVDDLAAGGTKNLRHTPRGLVTLSNIKQKCMQNYPACKKLSDCKLGFYS